MSDADLKARVLDHLERIAGELSSPARHKEAEGYGASTYQKVPLLLLEVQARKMLLETREDVEIGASLRSWGTQIAIETAFLADALAQHADIIEVIERTESYLRLVRGICC